MAENIFFDAHCDTLTKLARSAEGLRKNPFHVDVERLSLYCGYVQTFAAFVDKTQHKDTYAYVKSLTELYRREVEKNSEWICHCNSGAEIEKVLGEHRIASLLGIEGGEAIEGSIERLREFYESGVRMMTLTWNWENEICDGIGEVRGDGLTEFGKSVVREMNRLGMVIDVSHISQKGFWDVAKLSTEPFIASHSNAKRLCGHPRNLDDEQIKAIFDMNGCIGINFYPTFVSDGECCGVDDVIKHIEYFLELGGEDHIGLGSDFDGVESLPEGMVGVQSMNLITEAMEKKGFGKELIRKITYKNFMRVINNIIL